MSVLRGACTRHSSSAYSAFSMGHLGSGGYARSTGL